MGREGDIKVGRLSIGRRCRQLFGAIGFGIWLDKFPDHTLACAVAMKLDHMNGLVAVETFDGVAKPPFQISSGR